MTLVRQVQWLVGIALVLMAVYLLRGILLPFVAGMAVAYFLDPVCDRLERAGLSRTLATIAVTMMFGVIVLATMILLVPLLQGQIADLVSRLPEYIEAGQRALEPLLREVERNLRGDGGAKLREAISGQAGVIVSWLGSALGGLISGGLALANILSLVFITPVVAFYLLRDWDRMVARIDSWLPRQHADVIREQAREIDQILAGWVRGQGTVCVLLAAYYSIGLTVIGLDFGLIIGLVTGLLSFVPYVGTITGFVLSVAVAVAQYDDWPPVIGVAAFFVAGQMIEGNFLTPMLVGDRVKLHPVWVIFALLAGGSLFGFVGVLLALPVAAVLGVLARFALTRYLASQASRSCPPSASSPEVRGDGPPPIA